MAPPNKCLARSNKSRTGVTATNKGPAARRNSLCPPPIGRTRFGVSAAGLSPPFGGAKPREKSRNANRRPNEHSCAGRRMLRFGIRADIDGNREDTGCGHYPDQQRESSAPGRRRSRDRSNLSRSRRRGLELRDRRARATDPAYWIARDLLRHQRQRCFRSVARDLLHKRRRPECVASARGPRHGFHPILQCVCR